MLRRATVIVGVLCLLGSAVGVVSATTYTITDLGVTTGSELGYVDTYNGKPVVVAESNWYWTPSGAVNLLPLLPGSWGATGCTASGVNSSGQIDGTYTTASGTSGFVYTIGGSAEQINVPSLSEVGNINENGYVPVAYSSGLYSSTAVFNANTQTYTYPGGSSGNQFLPLAINSSGWISATNMSASPANPEVWNGSTWNAITALGTSGTDYAYGIDSNGDIVGKVTGNKAFYAPYDGGGTWGAAINLFSGSTQGFANGINDNQVIVGENKTAGPVAEIWNTPTSGSGVALSTLVTNLGSWTLVQGTGINDAGDIVGYGTNPSGTSGEVFLLTPTATPEPSTLLLAALGVAGLLAYAWRKRSFRSRIVVFAVVSLFSAAAGAAFAGTPYTLTDLGATTGSQIGYVDTYNGQPVVVMDSGWYWTQATGAVNLTPLLSSLSATSCITSGVNSSGQIDGTYYTAASGTAIAGAFVYTIGGAAEQINLPTGNLEDVGNINENGSVAVSYTVGLYPNFCPAEFNANTGAVTYPGGTGSSGTGYGVMPIVINASGWTAGPNLNNSPANAEVWNGSTWNNVPEYGTGTNYAYGIDSQGDIVGKAISSGYRAFFSPYNSGTGTWGPTINLFSGTTKGSAGGINDDQVIVGFSQTAGAAEIWNTPTTGSGVALSTLVTPSSLSTWTLTEATGIDNAADIVGWGTNPAGTQGEAFLLTPALPGDANLDGMVDINDLTIVLANYNKTGMIWATGDFVGDGKVDINDLTIVLANYGQTAGASAGGMAAVPEPSAVLLSAAALAGLLAYVWRKWKLAPVRDE